MTVKCLSFDAQFPDRTIGAYVTALIAPFLRASKHPKIAFSSPEIKAGLWEMDTLYGG